MPAPRVPDLGILRTICHGEKVSQDRRPWYGLTRQISIRITWLMLHTGITANQVTGLSFALTVAGSVLLALPSPAAALGGAGLLVAHYFLDKVDGEIARYRKTYSLSGVYLDELSHTFAYAGIFAGLGLHLAWRARTPGESLAVLAMAMVGAIAMVLVRQNKSMGALLYGKFGLAQPRLMPRGEAPAGPHPFSLEGVRRSRRGEAGSLGRSWAGRTATAIRDGVLFISEFTAVLMMVILGLAVEVVTRDQTLLTIVLVGQALLQIGVLFALIWINYSFNVEMECRQLNELTLRREKEARSD